MRSLSQAVLERIVSINARLCYGEILSQAGDAVGGILAFRKCAIIDPYNPLPFINTARTFNQMGQPYLAMRHINRALELDDTYCMTFVDLAQVFLQQGQTKEALTHISKALQLARHVSEIRDVLTAQKIALIQEELEQKGFFRQVNVVA